MHKQPALWMRLSLALLILCSCIGCDQVTKQLAKSTLSNAPTQSYLGDLVRLQYAENPGGFLSLGSTLSVTKRFWLFVGANSLLMLFVACALVMHWKRSLYVFVPLTCILAGGIGNLIDRVAKEGFVADFMNLGVGPLRTGIFNVADIAVTGGAIALILAAQFQKPRHSPPQ